MSQPRASGPRVLIDRPTLNAAVARLGAAISAAHPDGVMLVVVLKGSVWFAADLMRHVSVPVEVDFLGISSYSEGTGRVRIVKDLDRDIFGRSVVLVEDVVDTGLTLNYVLGELRRRQPASLEVCTLLDKATRRIVPTRLRFVGFAVEDDFLVGYGLDFAERYRNVGSVVVGDLGTLRADPDAYVDSLFSK